MRTTIIGVGNLLLGDEGVGVHVARQLIEHRPDRLPEQVEIIDGGTGGLGLLGPIVGTRRLVLIDAVLGGGEPATLYRFDLDATTPGDRSTTSIHQIGIEEVLRVAALISEPPRATVIGVEPADLSPSLELSTAVAAKLPRILELVLETVGRTRVCTPWPGRRPSDRG